MKNIIIKILKILIIMCLKQNKILCEIESYHKNKKIIVKENNNGYLFFKFLKEKIYYFNPNKIKIVDFYNILTSKIILHKTYPIKRFFINKKQINLILGYFTPFKGDYYKVNLLVNGAEKQENINEKIYSFIKELKNE